MIAKIPSKRRDKKSSFRDLTNYCLGITGHVEGSVLHVGLQNLYSATSAAIEMEALATENTRCKDPAFHFILSWRVLENPTTQQVDEAVKIALEELDLENCQALWALQADTENLHVHVAANRIDPETGRAIQPAGNWTKKALERAARRIEYAQGWGIEESGRYYVTPDGNIIEKSVRHAEVSQRARDLEVHTGAESLERVAKKQIAPILESSETWEELHRRLAEHGFLIEKKGSGAVLCAGDTVMKVSSVSRSCSLSKLEKRLGEFQERDQTVRVDLSGPSQAPTQRVGVDLEDSWKRYNAERSAYLHAKAEALQEKKEAHKKEFAALYRMQKEERRELYAKNSWKTRGREMNQLRSLMAYAQQKERLAMREEHWRAVDELKSHYLKRFPSYKKWLADQNNEELYAVYRYPGQSLLTPVQSGVFERRPRSMDLKNYSPKKGGSCVAYCREGAFTADFSDMGKRILLNEATLDKTSVVAALQLANQKWGATKITGNDDYKELCVAAAVEYNLKISNPDLAAEVERRRKIMLEKRQDQGNKARIEMRTESFMRYAQAVGAERFRIIVTDFQADGVKAFVFDRYKGGGDGKSAVELSGDIPRLDALEQKQHQNINVVPISVSRHHILIDDMSAEKLRQLKGDGYSPACVIESSPGNFQAILTVASVEGDTQKDRLAANRLTKELNEKYGDPRLSGAVHAHRLPPFGNYKPKHRDPDGKFPATRLVEAEGGLCRQAFGKLQQLHAEILAFEAKIEREKALRVEFLDSASIGTGDPNEAYWVHYRDIASRHGVSDYSVMDAMIGTRMRVTGFSSGEIQMSIEENAPKMRHENMSAEDFIEKYQYRDWKRFAKETTQKFVFGARGERQFAAAEPYRRHYLKLEGRREEVRGKAKAAGTTDPLWPSKEEIAALRLVDEPKIFTKPAKSGRYSGKISHIDTEKGYCVQLVGRRSLVVHRLDDLAISPKLGEFVKVSYETGEKAGITIQQGVERKQHQQRR